MRGSAPAGAGVVGKGCPARVPGRAREAAALARSAHRVQRDRLWEIAALRQARACPCKRRQKRTLVGKPRCTKLASRSFTTWAFSNEPPSRAAFDDLQPVRLRELGNQVKIALRDAAPLRVVFAREDVVL